MGSRPIGISASRGAAVLGLSQFSTRVDVWAQIMEDREPGFCARVGITPPEPVSNAAIRWGLGFESAVIQLAEIARGMPIGSREALCELKLAPFLEEGKPVIFRPPCGASIDDAAPITCHLDGLYSDGVIHEGKTTSAFAFRDAWGEPGTDRIPRAYQVQVQHQMLCSGATSAVVSVLVFPTRVDEWEEMGLRIDHSTGIISRGHTCDPGAPPGEPGDPIVPNSGEELQAVGCARCACSSMGLLDSATGWARTLHDMGFFHQYTVAADPALQSMMLDAYREFWTRYVLTEAPPPAETYSDILRLMPEPRGTVVADEQQERWASEYNQIGKEAAQSKKQQDKLKALLLGSIERGAEHPIDSDSVEAIVLRDRTGKKIASYSKGKEGRLTFRCGG